MISMDRLRDEDLDALVRALPRRRLPYQEYSFLEEAGLRQDYLTNLRKRLQDASTIEDRDPAGRIRGFLVLQPAEYDSRLLGLNMHRITDFMVVEDARGIREDIERALLGRLSEWAASQGEVHISAGISSLDPGFQNTFNALTTAGFYYVNTLMTFAADDGNLARYASEPESPPGMVVRKAVPADRDALVALCDRAFQIDRFHMDRALQNRPCSRIYTQAMENALAGVFADVLFVAEVDGRTAGYYSGRREHMDGLSIWVGHAISAAVSDAFRGRGVFKGLNAHLMHWFQAHCRLAEMGTYISNNPIHQTWIRERLPIVRCNHMLAYFRE